MAQIKSVASSKICKLMDLERWKQIDNLFSEALRLDPDKRSMFLEEVCQGDSDLKKEVEALLSSDGQVSSSIAASPGQLAFQMLAERTERFSAGHSIGPYKIVSFLGAGGMGEVYRANDTRLNRRVAIKILPAEYSNNHERMRRFEQESRSAGLLNHPNILTIYDVGTDNGCPYIVSELLEGQTFRKLAASNIPPEKIVQYMLQVANGLSAAHQKGIIHRDLKLENLFLTKDGHVKILDFGLAKLTYQDGEGSASARVSSATGPFQVLGTAGYMSPEQVQARPVDQRADIFAFGVVLYELLFGKPAFIRKTWVQSLNAILSEDPPEFSNPNLNAPTGLVKIAKRCLEKDPANRFQSASDLGFALENTTSVSGLPFVKLPTAKKDQQLWMWATIFFFVAAMLLGGFLLKSIQKPAAQKIPEAQTLSILLPEDLAIPSVAISPDGKSVAFTPIDSHGGSQLWVRTLTEKESQVIPGSEDARWPFWSPDGRSIGFFAEHQLRIVTIGGGSPKSLAAVDIPKGATWNRDGVIIYSPQNVGPLFKVSTSGGEATQLTTIDPARQEYAHRFPEFLPDGHHFFYVIRSSDPKIDGLYIGSLDSKDRKRVASDFARAEYVDPGFVLFAHNRTLMAQTFDTKNFEFTGKPVAIAQNVEDEADWGPAIFSAKQNTLVYRESDGLWGANPCWVDRSGQTIKEVNKDFSTNFLDMSKDGKWLLAGNDEGYWLLNLSSGQFSRFAVTDDSFSIFANNPNYVAYVQGTDNGLNLNQRLISGSGKAETLFHTTTGIEEPSLSADGRYAIFGTYDTKTKWDVWIAPLFGDRKPFPYLYSQFKEENAQFSPDGKWVAYVSDQSGRQEVYVQSFPIEAAGKWKISFEGANQPRWRSDGKELFFLTLNKNLMATEVKTGNALEVGTTQLLFESGAAPDLLAHWNLRQYFPDGNGRRFLINKAVKNPGSTDISVVLNWKSLLNQSR